MKRAFLLLTVIGCFSISVNGFAETDKEILFRDVPWGSSYTEVEQILSDFDWYAMSFEYMRHYPVCEVLSDSDSEFKKDFSYGGINMTAQPFMNKETQVAGYTTSDIELYYAFTSVDGIQNKNYDDTALYGARYTFEPAELQGMASDLKEKLSSVYGEADEEKEDTDIFGIKTTITYWHGANDTVVALRCVDTENDSTDLYDDEIIIGYAWEKGDELLINMDDLMRGSATAGEAANYGNGDTNGL